MRAILDKVFVGTGDEYRKQFGPVFWARHEFGFYIGVGGRDYSVSFDLHHA